jgi:HlyD family secretion protein
MRTLLAVIAVCFIGCKNKGIQYDASGAFEAVEVIVSAEANGVIKEFRIEEGMELNAGDTIGYIDSLQIYLKKKQLQAQMSAVLSRKPDISPQLAALKAQLASAERDQQRYEALVKADAAPVKKLDDINTQVEVLKSQIEATASSLGTTTKSITEETAPLYIQSEQIDDQLAKCRLINPVKGTVLVKYAEANEVAVTGKPLYKIADLSVLTLRAYLTGNQLPLIKIGQVVKVFVDNDNAEEKSTAYNGTVQWISDKAEFTPKTIQTKEERADKVYAAKIAVRNDGTLKTGMYAEVKFK